MCQQSTKINRLERASSILCGCCSSMYNGCFSFHTDIPQVHKEVICQVCVHVCVCVCLGDGGVESSRELEMPWVWPSLYRKFLKIAL